MSARIGLEAAAKRPGDRLLWHRRRLGKGQADRGGDCGELRNVEGHGIAQVETRTEARDLIMQTLYLVSQPLTPMVEGSHCVFQSYGYLFIHYHATETYFIH